MNSSGSLDESGRRPFAMWWNVLEHPRRMAFAGIAAALVVLVFLGLAIPSVVEGALLSSRRELLARVAADLADRGLLANIGSPDGPAALEAAIKERLLGADVLAVKVFDGSGGLLYSNALADGSETTPVPGDLARALGGSPVIGHPDSGEVGLELSANPTSLHEYYLPIAGAESVVAVFEVYERAGAIDRSLTIVRWMVWLSVSAGLAIVVAFLLRLAGASRRILDRRRSDAEGLVASMARSQEEERVRIMGSLHDDIAQPLYRVLHGIQGSRSQVDDSDPIADELDRLADVVRWIDGALRSELLMLHQGAIEEADLDTLLSRLVEDVGSETDLDISLTLGEHGEVGEGGKAALFRAVREAVTNVRRHAAASRVNITVTEGSHRIIADVEDDGIGFNGESGLGLETTRSRLETLGGGLRVTGGSSGGTLFRAWVPVRGGGL